MQNTLWRKFILFSLLMCALFCSDRAMAEKATSREYGIVVIPASECTEKASFLNNKIHKKLQDLANVRNVWHVTLYHGAYSYRDLHALHDKLKSLPLEPFDLSFGKIYSTADRWIDWGVQKSDQLQKLHESIVHLASPYHQEPLRRVADIYQQMSSEKKKQVDQYGVSGVMEQYNPHMTLFYKYPEDKRLQQVAAEIATLVGEPLTCPAAKVVIGALGYNGNITRVKYTIDVPQKD